jgi:hypothetical protein
VNASGLIESVASGIPRLDYYTSGGTAGCPALLVEPAATNLALHSRDLINAVWSGTTVTTAKNAVGADGTTSGATTITATAASGTVLQALSHASQSRVFSAYIRRVTGTGAIQLTTNGGTNWDTVTITSGYTQVASVGRTVASGTVGIRMAASGDVIEVDFTQGEVGPAATSPMATTTGTVTRNADVINLSSVSGVIWQTEGTIYMEIDYRAINSQAFRINSGTSNAIHIYKNILGRYVATLYHSIVGEIILSETAARTGFVKLAFAYKSGDSALVVNAATPITSATSFTFSAALSSVNFQDGIGDILPTYIRSLALYTTRLTNAELQSLTTL